MIPTTFPNRPYFLLIARQKASPRGVWMTEWDRFLFCFVSFPLCYARKAVGCSLHVLYITDLCHAGISNSNPCETFIPSDLAWQRREGYKKGRHCSHTGLLSISVLERSEQRRRNRMRGFQLLNQKLKYEWVCFVFISFFFFFNLSYTILGLFPQP